jgi:RNA polymerase sigma factor (sigma-70 family)
MAPEASDSLPDPEVPATHEGLAGTRVDRWARDYAEDLRRFLRKRRIVESDIKDICQEVYLRVLRFQRTEVMRNPQAYIFRVAANVAHDFRLLQGRWSEMPEGAEDLQTVPSAEELVEAACRKRALLRELAALPPLPRAAIALRYHEALSYEQIAGRLRVSPRSVKRAIARGYALMREGLRKDLPT